MPRNKLPNVVLEPLDEPIEIVENIEDLVEHSKKEHVNPFVEPEEPKPKAPLNYNNLTAKKLKELCKEAGYRNYSKLKKSDLIKMLNGQDVEIPEKPKKSISIDIEKDEVIPKQEKIKPKIPIKKEELKDNLVKEEPLIKNKVEEEVEVEVTNEELEEILEVEVVEKQKPKTKPALKPPQPVLKPPQPVLPPQKELYNPFKNYYNIY